MDYSKLSDFEINCRVAKSLGMTYAFWFSESEEDFDVEIPTTARGPIWQTREYLVNGYRPSNGNCFNPCNNAADAWPIILCNRITLMPASKGDKWMAQVFDHAIADVSTNPLRSAMIVFLMMQESE